MSFHTWINYGYGINLDKAVVVEDASKIDTFLNYAPEYKNKILDVFKSRDITEPTLEDYEELDVDYQLGFASLIKEVLTEYSGIEFIACDDFDSHKYVMYCPNYPWRMSETEKNLTKEKLDEIMSIMNIIVENPEALSFGFVSCENGG